MVSAINKENEYNHIVIPKKEKTQILKDLITPDKREEALLSTFIQCKDYGFVISILKDFYKNELYDARHACLNSLIRIIFNFGKIEGPLLIKVLQAAFGDIDEKLRLEALDVVEDLETNLENFNFKRLKNIKKIPEVFKQKR